MQSNKKKKYTSKLLLILKVNGNSSGHNGMERAKFEFLLNTWLAYKTPETKTLICKFINSTTHKIHDSIDWPEVSK